MPSANESVLLSQNSRETGGLMIICKCIMKEAEAAQTTKKDIECGERNGCGRRS